MRPKKREPGHPGEILQRAYLEKKGISQSELARQLGWKPGKISCLYMHWWDCSREQSHAK